MRSIEEVKGFETARRLMEENKDTGTVILRIERRR